jgi:cation transport protein ChaC
MSDHDSAEAAPFKPPARDFWVFGYGSLMWNPGFPYRAAEPAFLHGYHRAFCIYSYRYRGTHDQPGLVLGLDRGGCCRGRAYLVAAADAAAVAGYLHKREMITAVYDPRWLPVDIVGRRRRALAYVADRDHPQYAGRLPVGRVARLIRQGRGIFGSNLDYLVNTVRHMDELGIPDGFLHELLRRVEQGASAPD